MAGIEDLIGQFGGLMAPQPQAEPSQWERQLRDPATQAALLSFGLQALSGGWGNGAQQFAQAAGAGAQGGGTYNQQDQERTRYEQARQDQASNRAAERQTRLDVANIGAMSRQEIAALRAEAAAGRTDDRLQLNYNNNRRAAEATIMRTYNDRLALARAADRPAIIAERDAELARVARMYPLATDAIAGGAAGAPQPPAGPTAQPPGAGAPSVGRPAPTAPAAPTGDYPNYFNDLFQNNPIGNPAGAGQPQPLDGPRRRQPAGAPAASAAPPGAYVPASPPPGAPLHPTTGAPISAITDSVRQQVAQLIFRAAANDTAAATQLAVLMRSGDPELQRFITQSWNAARGRR